MYVYIIIFTLDNTISSMGGHPLLIIFWVQSRPRNEQTKEGKPYRNTKEQDIQTSRETCQRHLEACWKMVGVTGPIVLG